MITDLFSHKIHSSSDEWQDKLIEITTVYAEFDGLEYDRTALESRFQTISPRASIVARDQSKLRDELSAYPAYLGLYHLELVEGKWIFRLSETAKRFLIVEEPNVPSFLILQLVMFQFPNGKGIAYGPNGTLRIQANSRDKTLEYIRDGIHVSPFRLICKALLADSKINGVDSLHPRVTIEEIYILANDERVNKVASPSLGLVQKVLEEAREGLLSPPAEFERRFHLLNHTDFIQVTNGWIHLREAVSPEDTDELINKLAAIDKIDNQFDGFDKASSGADIQNVVQFGAWGTYFDGIVNLTAEVVQELTAEAIEPFPSRIPLTTQEESEEIIEDYSKVKFSYPLKPREEFQNPSASSRRTAILADPEVTRIKRQRSNLLHKIITQKMDEHLRTLGATPFENEHIDLYAKIPGYGSFLFEIKSTNDKNLLSQTRKGLSQLYEYRYRYWSEIGGEVVLCLVYPKEPDEILWLQDYLCNDRDIAICWFDEDCLCFPESCAAKIKSLVRD